MSVTMHNTQREGRADIWAQLAAKLPAGAMSWRQQGKAKAQQSGGFGALFVAYIEANTVRERLDSVVPGEWDVTIDLLPPQRETVDGEPNETPIAFKARLQILGVIREDVGFGKDYKQASTDAFKRVAVRFGIGAELYDMEPLWVQVDGDSKFAKPLEDPSVTYARKMGQPAPAQPQVASSAPVSSAAPASTSGASSAPAKGVPAASADEVLCPKCGNRTWDNRLTKKNPKAPDYKCRDRSCDGVVWPPKEDAAAPKADPKAKAAYSSGPHVPGLDDAPPHDDDDLPY